MNVIWSTLAKDYYLYIIEQLFEKWNIKVVEKFEKEINTLVDNISKKQSNLSTVQNYELP